MIISAFIYLNQGMLLSLLILFVIRLQKDIALLNAEDSRPLECDK